MHFSPTKQGGGKSVRLMERRKQIIFSCFLLKNWCVLRSEKYGMLMYIKPIPALSPAYQLFVVSSLHKYDPYLSFERGVPVIIFFVGEKVITEVHL